MRGLCFVVVIILAAFFLAPAAQGQTQTFSRDGVAYTLELPSPRWRAVERLDVHQHLEFVYGSDAEGYLRLRKNLVRAGTAPEAIFSRDEQESLKFLPGYVACDGGRGEAFFGELNGAVFEYEFTSGGQLMAGRSYYLQVDKRTIYALYFTAAREKLDALREQMDFIAGSFRMKESR